MNHEEKAKEIIAVSNTNQVYDIVDFEALHEAEMEDLLEMAEWKEQQMIEKVCEWLIDNVNDYLDWYDWEQCRVDKDKLLYDFRKAMKE